MNNFHGYNGHGFGQFGAATLMRDDNVTQAQTLLNAIGITDERGLPLAVDGIWGNHVNAAFANLYRLLGKPQPTSITPAVLDELRAVLIAKYDPKAPPIPGITPGVPEGSAPPAGGKPVSGGTIAAILGSLAVIAMLASS
jgi:hypothetical protein